MIHQKPDCAGAAPLDKGMCSFWDPESAVGTLLASHMLLHGTWLFQGDKWTLLATTSQWIREAWSLFYLWENELEMFVWDESWTELELELWVSVSLFPPENWDMLSLRLGTSVT